MEESPILLFLEGTYPWYRGGVSEWVYQYLQHFRDTTFNIVQVATDNYRNASLKEALYDVPDHVKIFERIPPPDLSKSWRTESYQWLDAVREKVEPLVEAGRIVHIANTGFAGWLGKQLAKEQGKPLMLTEHALYWKEVTMGAVALECGYKVPQELNEKKAFAKMFKEMARQIYPSSDAVISVSQCNIREQRGFGAEDVHYIPNGVPSSWLKKAEKKRSSTLHIGWIGRCAEMKNPLCFFDLIDSFNQSKFKDVQFIMLACDAGESILEQKVKAKSKGYSQLQLFWNQSTKDFIDRMDALCITSHNESQPLVLFEALARKVLPIGWETGDVSSTYGLILDRDASVDKLTETVGAKWNSPQEWGSLIESKFKAVKEHHIWDQIFDNYKNLFATLK